MARRFVSAILALVVMVVLGQGQARAQDRALAETLFNEGRRLMAEKRIPEACPKFAESQRIDPAAGTLLNLAACHEAEGKLATAWAEYRQAQIAARRSKRPDRVQFAGRHLAALETRLSYVTIHVPAAARVPGLEVLVDGMALGPAAWEVAAPMDRGAHQVTATAPGASPFQRDVTLAGPGERAVVDIDIVIRTADVSALPQPAKLTPPPPAAPAVLIASEGVAPAAERPSWWDRRGTAVAIGGTGAALVAVGAVFGLRAFSEWKNRDQQCSDPARSCTPGLTSAWIANITLPLGVLGLGAGSYRLLRGSW